MPGRNYTDGTGYRYGFNGKEEDNEIKGDGNSLDFGARMYDSRLGRWFNVDPLEIKYPYLSPYNFVNNTPVNAIDPDGKDIYLLVWATDDGKTGHAAIAVSNYKEVKTTVIENGKEVTKTSMEPDGTFTFYDLWPKDSGTSFATASDDVDGSYNKYPNEDKPKVLTWDEIVNKDPTGLESRAADGVIKFETSFEQDEKTKATLDDRKRENKKYNGNSNNCSDNAKIGLESALKIKISGKELILFRKVTTPNALYNDASKVKGAKIIKSPGKKVNNTFVEGKYGGLGKIIDYLTNPKIKAK